MDRVPVAPIVVVPKRVGLSIVLSTEYSSQQHARTGCERRALRSSCAGQDRRAHPAKEGRVCTAVCALNRMRKLCPEDPLLDVSAAQTDWLTAESAVD